MMQLFQGLLILYGSLIIASASSTNYNPSHYDLMRHFTPDGRLLQVEYAMRAAEHSSPLVVCQLDPDTLVMMTLQRSKLQDRIVVVDDGVVVAMSGVLSDNLALLRHAYKEWLDWKYMFGEENANSQVLLHVLSKEIAKECHWNSFQGGIRPFGASLLLAAVVEDKFQILQTDPSGAVLDLIKDRQPKQSLLEVLAIFGGKEDDQRKIEKAIQKWNDKSTIKQQKTKSVWPKLEALTKLLLQADQEDASSGSFFKRIKKQPKQQDSSGNQQEPPQLEVVLVSRKLGIRRLDRAQIERLLSGDLSS